MDKESLKKQTKKYSPMLVKKYLLNKLKEVSEQIQEIILENYDRNLSVVADRNSRTNPVLYRDEFAQRLSEFNYIEEGEEGVSLIVPDMQNFNFSGNLQVIETILEGIVGNFVELDEDQFQQVFNKKPTKKQPVYLVRYSPAVRQVERELNVKFTRCPFSNKAPVDIMEPAENFVNSNIERWIDEAIEKANKELVNAYKGVK